MITVALVLSIATAVISQYGNKHLLTRQPVAKVINITFIFCLVFAWIYTFTVSNERTVDVRVMVLGFVNMSIAVWALAHAIRIGLAKSIIFFPLINVIAVALSAVFLNEWRLLDIREPLGILTLAGVAATVWAAGLFGNGKSTGERRGLRNEWLLAMVAFIVVTGVVNFFIKYFAYKALDPGIYVSSWYTGSFIGSFIPSLFEGRTSWWKIERKEWWYYLCLSGGTVGAMIFNYWALRLAPATLVYPIIAFFYALGGALIGLYVFKEREHFTRTDWKAFIIGSVGALALIIGVR